MRKRNYNWKAGVYCGERWWKPRSWWRYYGLYRKIDNVGFSIGPILFYRESQDEVDWADPAPVIVDEVSDWDYIRDGLERLANGGVTAEGLERTFKTEENNDDRT